MQIHMSAGDRQPRWAWTAGLEGLGQQEMAVMLPWPEGDPRDRYVAHLLRFIETYIASQPKRILAGQTMHYGWSMLRFVAGESPQSSIDQRSLLIEELRDPFTFDQPAYVPGATRALELTALQREAIQRNRISGESEHPHRSGMVIVCNRVTPDTICSLRPLAVQRLWEPKNQYTGWFVSCSNSGHDHDNPDELAPVHLLHLINGFPALFPYLAMPVGTALFFESQQVIVFGPGDQDGHVDPAPLLLTLP